MTFGLGSRLGKRPRQCRPTPDAACIVLRFVSRDVGNTPITGILDQLVILSVTLETPYSSEAWCRLRLSILFDVGSAAGALITRSRPLCTSMPLVFRVECTCEERWLCNISDQRTWRSKYTLIGLFFRLGSLFDKHIMRLSLVHSAGAS